MMYKFSLILLCLNAFFSLTAMENNNLLEQSDYNTVKIILKEAVPHFLTSGIQLKGSPPSTTNKPIIAIKNLKRLRKLCGDILQQDTLPESFFCCKLPLLVTRFIASISNLRDLHVANVLDIPKELDSLYTYLGQLSIIHYKHQRTCYDQKGLNYETKFTS